MNILKNIFSISVFLFFSIHAHAYTFNEDYYRVIDSLENEINSVYIKSYDRKIKNIEKDYSSLLLLISIPHISTHIPISIPNNSTSSSYWKTVHALESKQGRLLFRPRNKSRNCNSTRSACGHHQLTVKALRDIGCYSLQCNKDRESYSKSLQMSKKLLRLNEQRLSTLGYKITPEYLKYLIHQQGAAGIKAIIEARKSGRVLSTKIKKNMANNSPYSYRTFKRTESKRAANLFLNYWKKKWEDEKRLISSDLHS